MDAPGYDSRTRTWGLVPSRTLVNGFPSSSNRVKSISLSAMVIASDSNSVNPKRFRTRHCTAHDIIQGEARRSPTWTVISSEPSIASSSVNSRSNSVVTAVE